MKQSCRILWAPFLLVILLVLKETEASIAHSKLYEFERKLEEKGSLASPKSNGRVLYPIGYGADPSGVQDSSSAIMEAVKEAGRLQNGAELLPGITDLGGVVIHLQGGNFRISTPITFPPDIGNIVVQGGSLRASTTFPSDRHLVELCAPDSAFSDRKDLNQGPMRYEDIIFQDILFDSGYQGGGLLLVDAARTRITDSFFLHFTTQGILVLRGHETFISNCFLGQHPTVGGDTAERDYTATAIDLASTDNAVTDVAIFSAATGVRLRGRANILRGVHCYNKATFFGGVGILVQAAQNRIVDAYLDYNSIVIEDPDQIHISDGFFLGDGNVVLKSVKGSISGLSIVNNVFSGDPKNMVPSVKLDGSFTSIDQAVVDHNVVYGMSLKSTVAELTVSGNGTAWTADFSPYLLFPDKINHVQYSFYWRGGIGAGFPAHALTNVSNNVVVIETQQAANAVVSVSVNQHNLVGQGVL